MEPERKSIVSDAEIYLVKTYLTKEQADNILLELNDDTKFKKPKLYFYDHDKNEIVERKGWRSSYWFGEHAQSSQSCNNYIINNLGEKIKIPTDFVDAYPFIPSILQLKEQIEHEFDVQFNSCLVGKFAAPDNKIGFHSDASPNMGEDPYIASVSFGKSRKFILKKHKNYGKEKVTIILEHGDLLLMRKNANRKYLHMVPADKDCNAENFRINLTFRNYTYDQEEIDH